MKNIKKRLKLGSYTITENSLPYIIAEIGVNHECSLSLAKKMIDQASQGGAHAVKFQSYKADKIASKNSPSYWDTREEKSTSQYSLFKKYDKFEMDDFKKLKKYCEKKNDANCKIVKMMAGISDPLLKTMVTFLFGLMVVLGTIVIVTHFFSLSHPDFVINAKPYTQEKCCPCNDDESSHSSL